MVGVTPPWRYQWDIWLFCNWGKLRRAIVAQVEQAALKPEKNYPNEDENESDRNRRTWASKELFLFRCLPCWSRHLPLPILVFYRGKDPYAGGEHGQSYHQYCDCWWLFSSIYCLRSGLWGKWPAVDSHTMQRCARSQPPAASEHTAGAVSGEVRRSMARVRVENCRGFCAWHVAEFRGGDIKRGMPTPRLDSVRLAVSHRRGENGPWMKTLAHAAKPSLGGQTLGLHFSPQINVLSIHTFLCFST